VRRFVLVLALLGIVSGLALLGVPRAFARFLKLAWVADMGFGEIYVGAYPGTVVLSPSGTRTAQGNVTLGSATGVAAAQFSITGEHYLTVAVVLPGSATLSSGTNSMTLDAFTSLPGGTVVLDVNGHATFTVGASLHMVAWQPRGAYSGTYNVTVAYN